MQTSLCRVVRGGSRLHWDVAHHEIRAFLQPLRANSEVESGEE